MCVLAVKPMDIIQPLKCFALPDMNKGDELVAYTRPLGLGFQLELQNTKSVDHV